MKTLLIHPKDITTDFAKRTYRNLECTLVHDMSKISKSKLRRLISSHDRIICLGHGTENGLINIKHSKSQLHHIIDSNFVYLLRQKNCILFWCHADEFQKKYKIPGLATGMIISDIDEAMVFGVDATLDDIKISNELLADALTVFFTEGKFTYKPINKVMEYNLNNLEQFI